MRCIELFQCYYWTFHFLADQISHQHSRDRALQKNGRLLIKGARKNVTQFTNNSNTLIDFTYLFVNMFQCKFFIKMYPQMLSSWCCWTVELWNRRGGSYTLVIFREKITSWPILMDLDLRTFSIYWPKGQLYHDLFLAFVKTTGNIEVSSAKGYTL